LRIFFYVSRSQPFYICKITTQSESYDNISILVMHKKKLNMYNYYLYYNKYQIQQIIFNVNNDPFKLFINY